jgi:cell division protein FtsB
MEQKIKALLGEYAFTVAALQVQIEKLQDEIKELKKHEDKPKRT